MPHSILSMFPFVRFLMKPDGEGQGGVAGSGEDYPPASDVDPNDVNDDDDDGDDSGDGGAKSGEEGAKGAEGTNENGNNPKEGEKPNDGKKPGEGEGAAPAASNDGSGNGAKQPEKPKQSSDENHKFAEMRRKAQEEAAKAAEIQKARDEGEIAGLGGKNPYTGKPIADAADLEVYRNMKSIKDDGGDPIADYPDFVAKKQRAEAQKALEASKGREEREKQAKEQIDQFMQDNPNVNLSELLDDPEFKAFANRGKLIENVPFQQVYDMFQDSQKAKIATETQKAEKKAARAAASDGSLIGNGAQEYYSLEQLKKMSPSEIAANKKKVDASYEYLLHHKK